MILWCLTTAASGSCSADVDWRQFHCLVAGSRLLDGVRFSEHINVFFFTVSRRIKGCVSEICWQGTLRRKNGLFGHAGLAAVVNWLFSYGVKPSLKSSH